jgi:hypothetical protein
MKHIHNLSTYVQQFPMLAEWVRVEVFEHGHLMPLVHPILHLFS